MREWALRAFSSGEEGGVTGLALVSWAGQVVGGIYQLGGSYAVVGHLGPSAKSPYRPSVSRAMTWLTAASLACVQCPLMKQSRS